MISGVLLICLLSGVAALLPTGLRTAKISNTKLYRDSIDDIPSGFRRRADGKVVKSGSHPEEYVLENDNGARAVVRTFGGNLFSWIPAGGEEVMGRRDDAVPVDEDTPGVAYAGGAPHCFPQFGPGSLMQHGFARGMTFIPEERAKKVSFDRMIFKLLPTEETLREWNHNFEYRFDVTLRENSLEWDIIIINLDDQPFDVTLGLHTYYDVSSLKNVAIDGPMGSIKIDSPIDERYPGVSGPVTITDSGKGTKLTLESKGFEDLAIWNPYGDNSKGFDKFVCVEPVCLSPVSIPPGKFKETKFYHKVTYERL